MDYGNTHTRQGKQTFEGPAANIMTMGGLNMPAYGVYAIQCAMQARNHPP